MTENIDLNQLYHAPFLTPQEIEGIKANYEVPVQNVKRPSRKDRIRLWKLIRRIGLLPQKPVAKIVGKHEFLRLEDEKDADGKFINDSYPEDGYKPSKLDEFLLSIKDRKVLDCRREWN